MLDKEVRSRVWSRFLALLSLWTICIPVLAGIIFPMLIPFGITGIFYMTWLYPTILISFDWWYFLTSSIYLDWWISNQLMINFSAILLIALGTFLLIGGLIQIVDAVVKKKGLITDGLYSIVRHPQHLGIALMTFGLVIWNIRGPRVGDLIAWTTLIFIYILLAEKEEYDLKKKLGKSYISYSKRVPFMIPLTLPRLFTGLSEILPEFGWRRVSILTGIYLLFLTAFTLILATFPLVHVNNIVLDRLLHS